MRIRYLAFAVPLIVAACSSGSSEITDLGLDGRIIYTQGPDGLWEIDLGSGESRHLWKLSEGGFLSGVTISPDGLEVAVAYAPVTDSPIPRSDIYLTDADGSSPQPLFVHRGLYEAFNHPRWSPDGQWIYFTRSDVVIDDVEGTGTPIVNIERIPANGGEPETVIENAEQVSFSSAGGRMTFLRFNQDTFKRSLWVANADGSEPMEVLPETSFFDLASPRLSPDGEEIAFAGSGDLTLSGRPSRTFWAKLLGVHSAYAHGLPWDFYTIPAKGGEPTKLTNWGTDGAVLAWSPSGDRLALMHLGGLFVTGSAEPSMLTETPNHGGVDWGEAVVSR